MEKYNYYEAVKRDVKEYIENEINMNEWDEPEELKDKLIDDLWIDDSVTGNASGSYYCNAWKAEEALCHNLDLLGEALEVFCCKGDVLKNGAEWCDVTIRCYLLNSCIDEVVDEMWEDLERC